MAAFCGCCGAEITLKAEACPVCGMPRHGMLSSDETPELSGEEQQNSAPRRPAPRTCTWD
jgi:hypothetical protein